MSTSRTRRPSTSSRPSSGRGSSASGGRNATGRRPAPGGASGRGADARGGRPAAAEPALPLVPAGEVEVEVVGWERGGAGRIRLNNGVEARIADVIPGEVVRVQLKRGAESGKVSGVLRRVVTASPDRVLPPCPHYEACGGCDMQHVAWLGQRAYKQERVRQALGELVGTGWNDVVKPTIGGDNAWHQRVKVGFQVTGEIGALKPAFFRPGTHERVPITQCEVQDPAATALALAVLEAASALRIPPFIESSLKGLFRAILVRTAPGTERRHVVLVCTRDEFAGRDALVQAAMDAGADGVSLSVHSRRGPALLGQEVRTLAGHARLEVLLAGTRYAVSPGAFFQTSRAGVTMLLQQVREALRGMPAGSTLVDLYCGVGLFSLAFARDAQFVIGIEENAAAIKDAEIGARLNGISNVRFIVGRAEHKIREVVKRSGTAPWAVIIDPPREGAEAALLQTVAQKLAPRRIIYVSCDPESLGRDAAVLAAAGYRLKYAQPIDMFPQTSHVEAVAVFDRAPGAPMASGVRGPSRVAGTVSRRRLASR